MESRRVLRLVRLREQQHLLTAMHLRTAQHSLYREEEGCAAAHRRAQGARDDLHQAQQSGVIHDWLLACAEGELCKAAAAHHSARRTTAQQAVQEASLHEASARTASKQMEHTFETARRMEGVAASHAEQLRLDEIARNLRAFSKSARIPGSLV